MGEFHLALPARERERDHAHAPGAQRGEGETRGADRHGKQTTNKREQKGCHDTNHDKHPITHRQTDSQSGLISH